jgi:HTH-type transcriptional regulator/antitoxin HipB
MSDDLREPIWARVNGPAELGAFVRERAELTQDQLAESIGVDRRYVYQVESGQSTLYALRLFALLRELDVELQVRARSRCSTRGSTEYRWRWCALLPRRHPTAERAQPVRRGRMRSQST